VKRIEGWRTYSVVILGMISLSLGLWFVKDEHRKDAFFSFSGGMVGLALAYAGKSIGTKAVDGDGLAGGFKNLMTDKKPGEP
jgi:hypothetical protein